MSHAELILVLVKRKSLKLKHNKRFKRDSQRAAFLSCVGFCGYGVMRKLGHGVGCPLTGRYVFDEFLGLTLRFHREFVPYFRQVGLVEMDS